MLGAMWTIAIAMRKGGTGKTSTAVNLAAALAGLGRRVLVMDLDPQHNASEWLEAFDSNLNLAAAVINGDSFERFVRPTSFDGIDCLPASPLLSLVEGKIMADGLTGHPPLLERCMGSMDTSGWSYLLVDCPPNLGILSLNALRIADQVLAPAPPDSMTLAGLEQLYRTVDSVRSSTNPALQMRVLLTRCRSRTRHAREVEETIRNRHGRDVYTSTVRMSVRMAEAWGLRKSIHELAPHSAIAGDFSALAAEVERDTNGAFVA